MKKVNGIKYGINGEFEYPAWELVSGKKPKDIKNLVWKNKGKIIINAQRPYLGRNKLDKIPFVSEFFSRKLNLKNYKAPSELYPYIDIMTGRGCVWGKCSYCLWVKSFIKGCTYNTRSVSNVIQELKFIKKELPEVKSLMIQDDTLPEWRALELSKAIIKSKLDIRWSCYSRANLGYKTMKIMERAGCMNLHVGYENADDKILSNIKKGITVKQMVKFTEDAHKAGLSIHADFAIGFLGETKNTIRKTIDLAKKLKPDTAQFQIMIPFEGTDFYEQLKNKGYLKRGEPSYPQLSSEEMRYWAKRAYREFYLSRHYLKRILRNPVQHFIMRFDTYLRAIPAVFWNRCTK